MLAHVFAGPETELWVYSSLERAAPSADDATADPDAGAGAGSPSAAARRAGDYAAALLREVRRRREAYEASSDGESQAPPLRAQPDRVLVGGLGERLRAALATRGLAFPRVTHWDKWLFRVDGLPDAGVAGAGTEGLPPGMRWGAVEPTDIPTVLARSDIQRTE